MKTGFFLNCFLSSVERSLIAIYNFSSVWYKTRIFALLYLVFSIIIIVKKFCLAQVLLNDVFEIY